MASTWGLGGRKRWWLRTGEEVFQAEEQHLQRTFLNGKRILPVSCIKICLRRHKQSRAFGNQFKSRKTSSKMKALSKIKAGNKFGKDHLHHLTQWPPGIVERADAELDLRGWTSYAGTPAPFWLAVCPQASFLTFLGLSFLSCESKVTTVCES